MRKKHIIIYLTMFIIILTSLLSISAAWRDNTHADIDSSNISIDKISIAEKNGDTIQLDNNDLNSISSLYFKNGRTYNGITIQSVNLKLVNNEILTTLSIDYKRLKLQLSTMGSISYSDSGKIFSYTPEWFKLGKLYLPKIIVLNRLSSLSGNFHVSNQSIEISKNAIPLNISNITLTNNLLTLKFNSAAIGTLNNGTDVKQALDNVQKQIKELAGEAKEVKKKEELESLAAKVQKLKNTNSEVTSTTLSEVESKLVDISNSSSSDKPDKINDVINKVNEVKSTVTPNTEQNPNTVGSKDALIKVSSQLSSAVSALKASQEKAVLQNIQASINSTIAEPNHDYRSDTNTVRSLYNTLSAQQKKNVKEALFSNVDASLAFKLRSVYGL